MSNSPNKILLPQLISLLSASSGKSKIQTEAFIKAFFSVIAEGLESHDTIRIKGFGTFKVTRVESRKSVNVATGAEMQIPAHFKVVFTPAKSMAEKVNRDFEWLDIVEISDDTSSEDLENGEVRKETETVSKSEQGTETSKPVETQIQEVEIIIPETAIEEKVEVKETEPREAEIVIPEEKVVEVVETVVKEEPEPIKKAQPTPAVTVLNPEVEVKVAEPAKAAVLNHEEKETEGERLGEEIEKEFGDIEPVEPFGPIDPDDPEPGTPIPENKKVEAPQEFDPYADVVPEVPVEEEPPFYITREEYETLVKRADIKNVGKHIKKLRAAVETTNDKAKKRSLVYFIWGIIVAAALVTGGLFIFYGILKHKGVVPQGISAPEVENTNQASSSEVVDDEQISVTVSSTTKNENVTVDTSKALENKSAVENPKASQKEEAPKPQAENTTKDKKESQNKESSTASTTAPTKPSDVKTVDKITTTRYLTTMAKEYYGNYNLWPYIYKENESKLGHPDRIKPGTSVVIPNLDKYGVDAHNPKDIEKARKLGVEIYKKFGN